MRVVAITLGALGLMAATAWIMRHEPSVARKSAERSLPAPPPVDPRELSQLRAELRALRAEVVEARAASRASAAEVTNEPVVEPAALFDAEHAAATRAQALAGRFEAEARDAVWSRDTASRLQAVFDGGAVAGTQLVAAECRATLCRVKLRHDDETASRELAERIADKEAFAAGVYYRPSPDDPRETTLYVLRARP